MEFEFVEWRDQNKFQGDALNLEWTFNAKKDGEERYKKRVSRFFIKKRSASCKHFFLCIILILLPFCKFKKFTKLFFGDTGVHRIFDELCPFGV